MTIEVRKGRSPGGPGIRKQVENQKPADVGAGGRALGTNTMRLHSSQEKGMAKRKRLRGLSSSLHSPGT